MAIPRADGTGQVALPAPRRLEPLTRTDIVKFAGAGGDFNPVHHDEHFAQRAGYPTVFAMGMFTAGLLGDYLGDWAGIDQVRSFAVRFASPAWPDDALDLRIGDANPLEDGVEVSLDVANGDEVRISGKATIGAEARAGAAAALPESPAQLAHLRETPPTEMVLPIERGKVMEFARAVKSANPLHFDPEQAAAAGFADIVAPLAFSAVAAHYNGGDAADLPRELGLDLSRMVHGEQRWAYHRPAVAGETLRGSREVAAAWTKPMKSGGAMTFVLVAIDYRDELGRPVLRDEMVMIELPKR